MQVKTYILAKQTEAFACGDAKASEKQKALAKQAAVRLSDIKKSSFTPTKPDDKPTERWLNMSPAQKKAEAEREKTRREKLERESKEKIPPYKAERLWEKEKHKYKDLDKKEEPGDTPNKSEDKPEPAGPGTPKKEETEKPKETPKVKKKLERPKPEQPLTDKLKSDSSKIVTDVKSEIDDLDAETKTNVVKTILDKTTTVVKNGKKYITKDAQLLGNISLSKLLAYSAGFALLGPFGPVLFHEAIAIGEDIIPDKSSVEQTVDATQKYISSIIPKNYTQQQREAIKNDFGRLSASKLAEKHNLDSTKLKDYLTFSEQIEKLKNSVPNTDGTYDVPLGSTRFKGTEDELKSYIEHLEEQEVSDEYSEYSEKKKSKKVIDKDKHKKEVIADLSSLPPKEAMKKYNLSKEDMIKHYYISDERLDKKIRSAKVDKYGKIRIKINGVELNDFPTKIKEIVRKYREDLFKVYDKQSAVAVKEKINETKQIEKNNGTKQGTQNSEYTETSISKQDQEALNLINDKPVDSAPSSTTKEQEVEQKIELPEELLNALPNRIRTKLKDVFEEAPEHLDPIVSEEEPEEQEEKPATQYGEPKKEIEPIKDEELEVNTDEKMEKTLKSVIDYYIQRDPQKLRSYFEQKYPKLVKE